MTPQGKFGRLHREKPKRIFHLLMEQGGGEREPNELSGIMLV